MSTVAEHFRAFDANGDLETAVELITQGLYPGVYKDRDYIREFIDGGDGDDEEQERQKDWYLDQFHPDCDETPIYDGWDELLSLCAAVIEEFAEVEYVGPTTHALIMDMAMKRLRKLHGLDAPQPWLPIICELRKHA